MVNLFEEVYEKLLIDFGPQNWWPAESPFEVMVGAILTQNTNWSNVAKAINNLKNAGVLDYSVLMQMGQDDIAQMIRPSGYFNLKAKRLKNFLFMISEEYEGELQLFIEDDLQSARTNLLAVKGIGPETADSILLYACQQPIFVIDTYTHRVFSRHHMVDEETDYNTMQETFMEHLPAKVQLYNEYHALIVRVAATYCKKKNPLCDACPLQGYNW